VRGSTINYDGRTEFYTVIGGKDSVSGNNANGRVRAVIQPKSGPGTGTPVPEAAAEGSSPRAPLNLKSSGGIAAPREDYPEPPKP